MLSECPKSQCLQGFLSFLRLHCSQIFKNVCYGCLAVRWQIQWNLPCKAIRLFELRIFKRVRKIGFLRVWKGRTRKRGKLLFAFAWLARSFILPHSCLSVKPFFYFWKGFFKFLRFSSPLGAARCLGGALLKRGFVWGGSVGSDSSISSS